MALYNKQVTEISSINENNLCIKKGKLGLITLKNKNTSIAKGFELIVRCPITTLDNFPIQQYTSFDPQNNVVDLKLPIDPDFYSKNELGILITKIQTKFSKNPKFPKLYPNLTKLNTHIKIKHLEKFDYTVSEAIVNKLTGKVFVKYNKPTDLNQLKTLIKPNMKILPFVQLYFFETPTGTVISMRPVKFYFGKDLNEETAQQLSKVFVKPLEIPTCDYYTPTQTGITVDKDMFKLLMERQKKDIKTETI
jgi:hypothetical protein